MSIEEFARTILDELIEMIDDDIEEMKKIFKVEINKDKYYEIQRKLLHAYLELLVAEVKRQYEIDVEIERNSNK